MPPRSALLPALPTRAPSMSAPQIKFLPLDSALISADGTFSGYASLFDTPDLSGDIIAPGAFADSIARRTPAGIKLLFHHDPREPIGVWTTLREDSRGLYAQGRLTLDSVKGRDTLALLRSGAIDGLSIGFRTTQASKPSKGGPRRLTKVDLWEISIVTFPMLPGARVTAVKSADSASHSPRPPVTPLSTLPATLTLASLASAIRANT